MVSPPIGAVGDMTRPHVNASLADLETLFESNRDSPSVLEQLFEELVERRSKGARALVARVSGRLAELEADDDDQNFRPPVRQVSRLLFPTSSFQETSSLWGHTQMTSRDRSG